MTADPGVHRPGALNLGNRNRRPRSMNRRLPRWSYGVCPTKKPRRMPGLLSS